MAAGLSWGAAMLCRILDGMEGGLRLGSRVRDARRAGLAKRAAGGGISPAKGGEICCGISEDADVGETSFGDVFGRPICGDVSVRDAGWGSRGLPGLKAGFG